MGARALIVYGAALLLVRLGDTRFLGKSTAFDVILGIILGSVLSRAINGDAPLLPTVVASAVLVGLHWTFAHLAVRSARLGTLVKGHAHLLVRDGVAERAAMARSAITEADLAEGLRSHGRAPALAGVAAAHLERSGAISVIPARRAPVVLEVAVADGVQTVHIRLE